ncbi:MAG TPA: hypothetical protein VMN36_02625 [Verrucomicrobiales bacterium]|nr:hypothetical protein [Verrucomicrobiales bacterium]
MMTGRKALLLFSTCLLTAAEPVYGAGDIEADLLRRRALYRAERRTVVEDLRQVYLRELRVLEMFYATNEEYTKASACRDARRSLLAAARAQAASEAQQSGGASPRESVFSASGARDLQGLRRDPATGLLELDPEATEGAASWTLPGLDPGGYTVFVDYLATAENTLLRVGEARYFVQGALSPLPEGAEVTRQSLGNLKVTDGGGILRLVMEVPEGQHRTAISSVRLVSNAP